MNHTPKDKGIELSKVYELMKAHFGHQSWWPAKTPFEVCVGAILTQNTSWSNVEKALANLENHHALSARAIHGLSHGDLAVLIKSAGYYNIKADRLKAFAKVLVEEFDGSLDRLFAGEIDEVRARLLSIRGIGPETADSMLLYAGGRLSFVVDAYTKRVFSRHGWCASGTNYHELQRICSGNLSDIPPHQRLDCWQDFHAQLVMVGKHFCKSRKPLCWECPLKTALPMIAADRYPAEVKSSRDPGGRCP